MIRITMQIHMDEHHINNTYCCSGADVLNAISKDEIEKRACLRTLNVLSKQRSWIIYKIMVMHHNSSKSSGKIA